MSCDVHIRDVAPRLAFQAHDVDTGAKVELIDRLTAAGVPAIEVSSFVRPDLVPGLADAADVFANVNRRDGVSFECCVGGAGGLRRAVDAGADAALFLLSADEGFSQFNSGRSVDESLDALAAMRALVEGTSTALGTYVIFAWGGPVGPPRRPQDLDGLLRRLLDLGVDRWVLADSGGYGAPRQIADTVRFAASLNSMEAITVQVHDSRGMGLADVAELACIGAVNIDTAITGAGGHPLAPGAAVGGVCTEDAVQLLHLLGHDTGIDLGALIDAANWFDELVGGHQKGFVRHVGAVPGQGVAS